MERSSYCIVPPVRRRSDIVHKLADLPIEVVIPAADTSSIAIAIAVIGTFQSTTNSLHILLSACICYGIVSVSRVYTQCLS